MSIIIYPKGSSKKLSDSFRAREFDCPGTGCCTQTPVDSQLVTWLQAIRTHFGKPLIPLGYRCARYNATVPNAARNSYHTYGRAADFHIDGVSPAQIAKYAESLGILGIGLYDSFVHIDTRTVKSYWYGHSGQKRETFGGAPKEVYTLQLKTLKKGSTGQSVRALQILLAGMGYGGSMGKPDGIYGTKTEAAVKLYQKAKKLTVDGIAGANTLASLLGASL